MKRLLSDAQLEGVFVEFSDDDLIAELTRRKRVRVIENSTTWFNELVDDTQYMGSVEHVLVRGIAQALNNKLYIDCVDVPLARDAADRPTKTMRKMIATVIVREGLDDDA